MHTLATTRNCRHARVCVTTKNPIEFVDLTEQIEALVDDAGIFAGLVHVPSLPTTNGIVVNEHEPLLHGRWQQVLVELDGPPTREVSVLVLGGGLR